MMKSFSCFHPVVLLIYFAGIIGISMFSMNPVMSLTAIVGGILFKIMLDEKKGIIREIIFYIVFGLVITLTNPIFSHNGATVLFFVNNTPITMESFIYGGCAGLMLVSVLCWFSCFSIVMTSDKIIYLFSGVAPVLGLVLSSALKFVPSMISKYREIYSVQKSLTSKNKSRIKKLPLAVKSFSGLITWAIEHTADTASSMNSRGYGLKRRTSFSLFRFRINDFILMIFSFFTFSFMLIIIKAGESEFIFYPKLMYPKRSAGYMLFSAMWIIMVMIPVLTELWGELKWKLSR